MLGISIIWEPDIEGLLLHTYEIYPHGVQGKGAHRLRAQDSTPMSEHIIAVCGSGIGAAAAYTGML